MGFFAEFDAWLTDILSRYIADNTAAIARILEPAIVTLGVFYVIVWGYLQLMGKIEEEVRATQRAKSPEVAKAVTLAEKLGAFWTARADVPAADRASLGSGLGLVYMESPLGVP